MKISPLIADLNENGQNAAVYSVLLGNMKQVVLTLDILIFSSLFNIISFLDVFLFVMVLKSARLFLLLFDEKRSDPLSDTKALKDCL